MNRLLSVIAQRLIQGQNFFEYLEVSLFWFRYLIENTSLDQKSDKFLTTLVQQL